MESTYFRLSQKEREARKAYAREKYKGPSGAIQKRKQYMKCLRSGLIQRWKESTLARHGIVFDNGDFRFIEEDSAACRPNAALVREEQEAEREQEGREVLEALRS